MTVIRTFTMTACLLCLPMLAQAEDRVAPADMAAAHGRSAERGAHNIQRHRHQAARARMHEANQADREALRERISDRRERMRERYENASEADKAAMREKYKLRRENIADRKDKVVQRRTIRERYEDATPEQQERIRARVAAATAKKQAAEAEKQ